MLLPKFDANMIEEIKQIIKRKFAGLDRKEIKKMFRISVAQQIKSCTKTLEDKSLSDAGRKIVKDYKEDLERLDALLDESETPGYRNAGKRKKAMAQFFLKLMVMNRKYRIQNTEVSNTVDAATVDFDKEKV